jgi:hypothetical protein
MCVKAGGFSVGCRGGAAKRDMERRRRRRAAVCKVVNCDGSGVVWGGGVAWHGMAAIEEKLVMRWCTCDHS